MHQFAYLYSTLHEDTCALVVQSIVEVLAVQFVMPLDSKLLCINAFVLSC